MKHSFLYLAALWMLLFQQLSAQNLKEIASQYSIRTLPNRYFGKTDGKGHLLSDTSEVIGLRFYGEKKFSVTNDDIIVGNRATGVWRSEMRHCNNLLYIEDSTGEFQVDLSHFKELRELYVDHLSNKQLEQLFTTATHLRCLRAYTFSAYPESFCNMRELEYLEEHPDYIDNKLGPCIKELPSLKYIKVSKADSTLVADIFSIPSLEVIEIHSSPNVIIPASVANLKHLKQISLVKCTNVVIPEELYDLDSLELLQIENASDLSFPENKTGFKSLKAISLTTSVINHFPAFSDDNQLVYLNYDFGGDITVNYHLSNLKSLKRCRLNPSNYLLLTSDVKFPEGLENLTELEELHLDLDDKTFSPSKFTRLTKLHALNLFGTIVTVSDIKNLGKLPSLKYIYFQSNPITIDKIVAEMKKQELLFFTEEMYESLPTSCFSYYPTLIRDRIRLTLTY